MTSVQRILNQMSKEDREYATRKIKTMAQFRKVFGGHINELALSMVDSKVTLPKARVKQSRNGRVRIVKEC